DPEPLEAIDTLAVLLSDWATLISVLEKKSQIASDDENASIWRRIAETKLDMIEDPAGAAIAYERALELDPDSARTVDALIDLYEPVAQGDASAANAPAPAGGAPRRLV